MGDKGSYDKPLFFITLSFICIWLVIDSAVGENYLKRFLATIFPFIKIYNQSDNSMSDLVESWKNGSSGNIQKVDPETGESRPMTDEEAKDLYEINPDGFYTIPGTFGVPNPNWDGLV